MPAKLILTIFILSSFTNNLSAQETKDWRLYEATDSTKNEKVKVEYEVVPVPSNATQPGIIKYFQDEQITLLDSLREAHPNKLDGYRVQIFFGSREDAREMRTKFIQSNPEVGAYISYLAPNFRLRVGDFRDRLECEAFKKEIARNYPGSYLVKDKIELPELRPEIVDESKTGN
jgi:hypothetical protein